MENSARIGQHRKPFVASPMGCGQRVPTYCRGDASRLRESIFRDVRQPAFRQQFSWLTVDTPTFATYSSNFSGVPSWEGYQLILDKSLFAGQLATPARFGFAIRKCREIKLIRTNSG